MTMQGKEIKFSIITVCFNSEKTIRDTVESVLNQTYKNYEYIIIDGKSNDNTVDIIREYEDAFGGKLTIVSENDSGIYDAMNKGIRIASGELVGIINSDDYYEKDTLEIVAKEYDEHEYEILYGFLRLLDHDIEKSIQLISHNSLKEAMIPHPTCFVSKKIYEKYGAFSLKYKFASDYDFMLRMANTDDVFFKPVYKILANFRVGGVSTSRQGIIDELRVKKNYGLINEVKFLLKYIEQTILYKLNM